MDFIFNFIFNWKPLFMLSMFLIRLFVLNMLKSKNNIRYKSYLTILYWRLSLGIDYYLHTMFSNPFAFVFWTRFVLGITKKIFFLFNKNPFL